jgi:hypothetical protein
VLRALLAKKQNNSTRPAGLEPQGKTYFTQPWKNIAWRFGPVLPLI